MCKESFPTIEKLKTYAETNAELKAIINQLADDDLADADALQWQLAVEEFDADTQEGGY